MTIAKFLTALLFGALLIGAIGAALSGGGLAEATIAHAGLTVGAVGVLTLTLAGDVWRRVRR
jgi:hypothetical protein